MRLFTFGCSMTGYHYPTWADIVGKNFDFFENWGRPGAGNGYILHALNRCHLVNNLTSKDTVMILWSGLARIDSYQVNCWKHTHSKYFEIGNKDSYFSCPDGYQWLSFSWMASALHMLQHLEVNFKMFHWQALDQNTEPYQLYKPVLESITFSPFVANQTQYPRHGFQQPRLSIAQDNYTRMAGPDWPSLENILNDSYKITTTDQYILSEVEDFLYWLNQDTRLNSKVNEIDNHPSPRSHLNWVKKYLPDHEILPSVIDWIENIDQQLLAQQPLNFEFKRI